MKPEQEKLLSEILKKIVEALYQNMGEDWCKELCEQISQLRYAGKR